LQEEFPESTFSAISPETERKYILGSIGDLFSTLFLNENLVLISSGKSTLHVIVFFVRDGTTQIIYQESCSTSEKNKIHEILINPYVNSTDIIIFGGLFSIAMNSIFPVTKKEIAVVTPVYFKTCVHFKDGGGNYPKVRGDLGELVAAIANNFEERKLFVIGGR
jgi:hypothetical protein